MESNKSAFLDEAGKPFRIAEAPIPKPGPNDIVLKNHGVAINPVDNLQYSKGVLLKSFPAVLGSDVAGEVYEVGKDVTRFKKGDRVVGHTWLFESGLPSDGAYTLYSKLPAANAAIIPSNITYKEATVLPLAIDTATSGLFKFDGLGLTWPHESTGPTGKTVLVYGASSSVGSMGVQLATAAGYRVIGIASRKNAGLVKEAGAEELFDYNDKDIVDQLVKAIDGASLVGIFDSIGSSASHSIIVPLLEKLGGTGKYVTTKETPENLPEEVYTNRMRGIGEFSFPLWENFVSKGLESGKLKCLPKAEVIGTGLEAFQSGVEQIGKGVSGKKLVVEI